MSSEGKLRTIKVAVIGRVGSGRTTVAAFLDNALRAAGFSVTLSDRERRELSADERVADARRIHDLVSDVVIETVQLGRNGAEQPAESGANSISSAFRDLFRTPDEWLVFLALCRHNALSVGHAGTPQMRAAWTYGAFKGDRDAVRDYETALRLEGMGLCEKATSPTSGVCYYRLSSSLASATGGSFW